MVDFLPKEHVTSELFGKTQNIEKPQNVYIYAFLPKLIFSDSFKVDTIKLRESKNMLNKETSKYKRIVWKHRNLI